VGRFELDLSERSRVCADADPSGTHPSGLVYELRVGSSERQYLSPIYVYAQTPFGAETYSGLAELRVHTRTCGQKEATKIECFFRAKGASAFFHVAIPGSAFFHTTIFGRLSPKHGSF
jgi:hypothetical protein